MRDFDSQIKKYEQKISLLKSQKYGSIIKEIVRQSSVGLTLINYILKNKNHDKDD